MDVRHIIIIILLLIFFIGYTLYYDSDYEKAYNIIIQQKGKFYLSDMKQLLEIIMGFPPLNEELEIFYNFSGKKLEEEISFQELINTLNEVRKFLNKRAGKSKKLYFFWKLLFWPLSS